MATLTKLSSMIRGDTNGSQFAIQLADDGFSVKDNESHNKTVSVLWNDIARVRAYKVDLLTTDCVCLLFELHSTPTAVQVTEEWDGFDALKAILPNRLPTIRRNWHSEVISPAFVRNESVIFETSR